MHFICRSFLGHTSQNSWSQVWENEPDDQAIFAARGHLFALANLTSPTEDAALLGRELMREINERYYSTHDSPASLWLKNSLDLVISNPRYQSTQLSLLLAVVLNNNVYIAVHNTGQVVFRRGDKIARLLTGIEDQVTQINGTVNDKDSIFLCTKDFFDNYSWDDIKTNLALPTIQDIEENFLSRLYTFESQSTLAGLLIQIHGTPVPVDKFEPVSKPTHPATLLEEPASPNLPQSPDLVKSKISLPKVNLFSKDSYVSHLESPQAARRKKTNLFLSLLILSLLFGSVYVGYQRNKTAKTENRYQELKTNFTDKLNNAKAVRNLSLEEAQKLTKEALGFTNEMKLLNIHQDEIKDLISQADHILSQTGSADSFHPEEFYDTTLINNSAAYTKIITVKDRLYLLDNQNHRIDSVDISKKSQQKISDSAELKDALGIAENSGQIFVLKGSQIFQAEKNSLTSKIDFSSLLPGFTAGQIHFWNGSLYLLSLSDTPSLVKFAPTSSGFLPGASWLKGDLKLSSNASSFAINGDIWVISKNGQITPYNLGIPGEFKAKTSTSLSSASNLVTAPDSDILGFTDSSNLLYIFKKTGESASSYNFGSRGVESIALDSKSSSVFVLCKDQKIYRIGLNQ